MIYFGSANEEMCEEFTSIMKSEFEMSMMGELNFFLLLRVKQLKEGTFIIQKKYAKELIKKIGMENSRKIDTPMASSLKLDNDKASKLFILISIEA